MKKAPNLKHQPRDKMTEVIIFAGSDAWAHAKQWQEQDGRLAGDNVPPVWLGEQQLSELDKLQIVPDGRYRVRLYQAGLLRPGLVNTIGQKLAAAGVRDADYYPEGMHSQKRENWREYLERERAEQAEKKKVVELPVKKKEPCYQDDELKPSVESRVDGVFWVTPKVDKQSGEIIRPETWLCSPLELLGTGTIGKEHYRVMRWKKLANHEVITMAIPCGGIGDRDGWRLLKDHGLNVTTNGKYRAILGWLSSEIADTFASTEEDDFVNGDGNGKPKGFMAYTRAATSDKTRAFGTIEKMVAASGTAITADELIDILYKLKAKYRKNAVWVMNSGTAGALQKLKNENGDYIWRDSLKEGAPDMLLGRPVYCLESMPDIGAGKAPLAVGDFSRGYFIVDHVTGIRTRPDNITEPGFYKVHTDKYLGGGVVDSNAIKILEMKAG